MKNQLEIKHTGETGTELTIREGAALQLKEPEKVNITGVINTPVKWLQKRITEINQKKCHVLIEKSTLSIKLVTDEENFYKSNIVGKLEFSDEFKKFKINSGEIWDCFSLSDFIKMNRSFFQDKAVAMNLVTQLRNFKAKVSGEIEKFKDDRANYELRKKQVVDSNLPDILKLKIPVFKGERAISLNIEICIEPVNFGCTLVSPEATDFINEQTEAIFKEQIEALEKIAPDIAILEV